ncbi:MAG: phosphatase PAP2 family protein, partial [candidate division Zixibacteria bacterium]|nr:phosphatase PAP2 family protein [candidate division Zixibacteria bacterium]
VTVFVFINQTIQNGVMDIVMPFITTESYFIVPLGVIIIGVALLKKRQGVVIILWGAVLITISDQLSSSVIKPMVGRLRPCHELDIVRLLVDCGPGKSFPSSHAVNIFAAATYFGEKFLHRRREFYAVAAMVAISRIYCGVHYPLDVLAGSLIGILVGTVVLSLDKYLGEKYWLLDTESR